MGGEVWKPIAGYEGYYEVSNHGNIRSVEREVLCKNGTFKTLKGRTMAQSTHYKNGYKSVMLTINSKQKRLLVHRLVANAFIDNPNNLPEVNHKDENKSNNNAGNLEWCTHEYNNNYGTKKERLSLLKSKSVIQLKEGQCIAIWPSEEAAARAVNGYQSGISACCLGKINEYLGFTWVFS